jgi:hypothetical protein
MSFVIRQGLSKPKAQRYVSNMDMDPLTSRFHDGELEAQYCAKQFREAFFMHVSYSVSLVLMFIA